MISFTFAEIILIKRPFSKTITAFYIFLNDGKLNFKQSYFYQMNRAHKATMRDYDLDGDLDIAAISFFPDYVRYPAKAYLFEK